MKCKNCGKETKIRVDDGYWSVVEYDTCMKCRGWMVCDSTSLIDIHASELDSIFTPSPGTLSPGIIVKDKGQRSDFSMFAIHWSDDKIINYINGKKVNVRKPVRFKRLRRFVKLLMSRNLRQRLERYQIEQGRVLWIGNLSSTSTVIGALNTMPEYEFVEIYRRSGIGDQSEEESDGE